MTSVISLIAEPEASSTAAELVRRVGEALTVDAAIGTDGSWELVFAGRYADAHSRVVGVLDAIDPSWPRALTVDYALTL